MEHMTQETTVRTSTIEFDEAVKKITKLEQRAERNQGYGSTIGARKLTKDNLGLVTDGVIEALAEAAKARPNSNEFKVRRVLMGLRPELIALAILTPALNAVGQKATHRDAALAVGRQFWNEAFKAGLLKTTRKAGKGLEALVNPKAAKALEKTVGERFTKVGLRQAQYQKRAADLGFTMEDWSEAMLAQAGQWGLNVLLKTMPDVFELREMERQSADVRRHKPEKAWTIKDEAAEYLERIVDEVVLKSPVYQPRSEQPEPWVGFTHNRAEDSRFMAKAQLVRTPHKETAAAIRHAIKTGQMDKVILAVNNLQNVGYKLNAWIMNIAEECDHRGIKVAGVPGKITKVNPRSSDEAWAKMSKEERFRVSEKIRMQKKKNRIEKAQRMKFDIDMRIARRLQLVDAFWTPMNLDWRGRMYFLTLFNFQREDYVRGMFLFANGKPVGERGIYHLKLQVANTGDFGKVSKKKLEERIAWVEANLDWVRDCVSRPLYNTKWTEADKPFAFLAAARELVNALQVGPTYVCHLPVAFDGSCNGLQHLCAMTRDPQGQAVNLTDNEQPEDIYQAVADIARASIEKDKDSDVLFYGQCPGEPERKANATLGKLAQLALEYGVDRKLVKRNVMTFAYSSKENGMKDQHVEDTMATEALEGNYPFGTTYAEWTMAGMYLAKHVMAAIKTKVTKPAEAMAFMQVLAQTLAHESKVLEWKTPMGLPWINRYHAPTTERIKLHCYSNGVSIPMDMKLSNGFEKPVEKRDAANGVAPNFVHALDGCHLQMSVNAAVERGVIDIATVHDSFGCLPADADLFNEVIREEFLRLYTEHDVLQELLDAAMGALTPAGQAMLAEKLLKHPKPTPGTLDLEQILSARYAFA